MTRNEAIRFLHEQIKNADAEKIEADNLWLFQSIMFK